MSGNESLPSLGADHAHGGVSLDDHHAGGQRFLEKHALRSGKVAYLDLSARPPTGLQAQRNERLIRDGRTRIHRYGKVDVAPRAFRTGSDGAVQDRQVEVLRLTKDVRKVPGDRLEGTVQGVFSSTPKAAQDARPVPYRVRRSGRYDS